MSAGSSARRLSHAGVFVALIATALPTLLAAQSIGSQQVAVDPAPPARDFSKDLQLKVTAPFTVAAAGDVMIRRPFSTIDDPDVQFLFNLIRGADIAVGNMEGNLADIDHFEGPLRGMMGSKEVAPDLKNMGFDLLGRANNHVFDSEVEGLFSTIAQLDAAGIVNAGTGKNLADARKPAFLETSKGRVAYVAMHSPHSEGTAGRSPTDEVGNIGGKAGMNALNVTMVHNVTKERLEQLKALRREMYTAPAGTTNAQRPPEDKDANKIQFLDTWYQVGTPGTKSFDVNKSDQEGILRSIRNGKTLSDFAVVSIHAHQAPIEAQQWLFEDQTPAFLIDWAHQTIDAGADIFVGSGPHVIRGIEIYKGKPIFYGLGEFFYQWQQWDSAILSGTFEALPNRPGAISDVAGAVSAGARPVQYESLLALSDYDKGQLVAVRLYPVSGNWDGPISRIGTPKKAPPEMAKRILERVAKLSEPFGTRIVIENGVGIIRVAGARTTTTNQQ